MSMSQILWIDLYRNKKGEREDMRNVICTILISLFSITLSSCGVAGTESRITTDAGTAVSGGAAVVEEEWKSAYETYLNKIYKSSKDPDYWLFYFCKNIDESDIPELFVINYEKEDEYEMKIYTYTSDVEQIGSRFLTGTSRLLYSEDSSCPGIFTFDFGGDLDRYGYITVEDGKASETDLWTVKWTVKGGEEEDRQIKEISSDKRLIRESKKAYREERDILEFKVKPENYILIAPPYDQAKMKNFRIDQAKQKTLEKKKATKLNIKKDDPWVQSNNNRMNGSFVLPYQEGYFYDAAIGEQKSDSVVVYQDAKGNTAEQEDMCLTMFLYEDNGFVYFYDDNKRELKRRKDGKTETIIEFFYTSEMEKPVFFAEEAIYYTDITDEYETYVCKVGYDGTQKQELYKIDDVHLEQIYKYGNELWFISRELIDTDSTDERYRLGKINLDDDSLTVYEGIDLDPEGRLSFNNGYVYFSSNGLNRINIREECVEQVFGKNVYAVNFTDDSLLFCKNRTLYRMDSDGMKKIKTLKGSTDGFNGIRVEDNEIYIGTYSGALYSAISQIDKDGKTVKNIMKD